MIIVAGLLSVALSLASEATEGDPEAAIVVILRADVAGAEVQAVATCGTTQTTRPIDPVVRLKVQITIEVVVVSSAH